MEDITLREIIEVIIKEKKIIAILTVLCIFVAFIFGAFFTEPVYQSQAMLMISPITNASVENAENNNFSGLVEALSKYPQMTIDTYREQVKAPAVLQDIRQEMALDSTPLKAIANKIKVDIIKNTNLITITVSDESPARASRMANLVSEKFTQFVSETNKKQAENSAQFIKEQMDNEKKNLDVASDNLKKFLSTPRGPQELQLELDSKLTQLTEFKTRRTQVNIESENARESLQHGRELLKSTPKTLLTKNSIINDELLTGIIKENSNISTAKLANLEMTNEQINQVYVDLSYKVNELEILYTTLSSEGKNLDKQIQIRQSEIENIQADLAEKQKEFDMINHEVELVKQTYDAYQKKYKEAMIKQSAEIGKSSIVVVSEAVTPLRPVDSNILMYFAIALIIGLGLGTFIAFVKYYWTVTKWQVVCPEIKKEKVGGEVLQAK